MGRGKNWDAEENEVLARAWLTASEDPVIGTDQTGKDFFDSVRRRFIEKGPHVNQTPEWRYSHRTVASMRQHFGDMSADVQKFRVSLIRVRASNPTGVGEEEVIAMSVAIHTGRTNVMEYEYKDFDENKWVSCKAWRVLRHHPKWADVSSRTNSAEEEVDKSVVTDETGSGSSSTDVSPASNTIQKTPPTKTPERFGIGSRGAKQVRQELLRTQAVRSMAESAKRKSDALEERNAISVFSRPEASGLSETGEFFAAIRRTHLVRALKRAKLAEAETTQPNGTEREEAEEHSSDPTP